ncbi:MAG: phosphomannose isomerase type II C-terminal cupin domain [Nanoarchaeota archaeon]|nr:phosphomannose isomerase type II C-terminal cupin domain [Nanoarchaeota archaeon]
MVKIVERPWGSFKEFAKNKRCTVKLIEINPKQELSLQKHQKREENWYFLTPGIVQVGNKKIKVREGSIIKIKKLQAHRVIADNKEVKFLEISLGKFSEKDEVRLEDKYNRK